jgi:hypothetical protein
MTTKIKPTRNELLDAIVGKIYDSFNTKSVELKDQANATQALQRKLEQEQDDARLKINQFDDLVDELEAACNSVLKKHGFSNVRAEIRGNSEKDEDGEYKIRPQVSFNHPKGKFYKPRPTKILNRKIQEARDLYQELHKASHRASSEAYHWDVNGRHGRDHRSAVRSRIVERLMQRDDGVLEAIDKAAKTVTADMDIADEIVKSVK